LTAGLDGGGALSVADYNRRLRDLFAALFIDADGLPVPIWKLAVPAPVADELATVAADMDAIIARRTADLALATTGPEHNGEGFQDSR